MRYAALFSILVLAGPAMGQEAATENARVEEDKSDGSESGGETEECFRVLFSADSDDAARRAAVAQCRLQFPPSTTD